VRASRPEICSRLTTGLIRHRIAFLILIGALTLFFAIGLRDLRIGTVFSDLLPSDHPYVAVFKDHPSFGSPLSVQVVILRKGSDIYRADTLAKVWQMTLDLHLVPGVDHDRVLSIASEKVRVARATPFGIESEPLMGDAPPQRARAVAAFRDRVRSASGVIPFLVSPDQSATLIEAAFIEDGLDYGALLPRLDELAAAARDAEHEVYLTGLPVLIGWVHAYQADMLWIFALTAGAMCLALLAYARNLAGVITPLVVSAVSVVWGFGFAGWVGFNVEPLVLVVPLLLIARAFSHCVQVTERYYEILHRGTPRLDAASEALRALLVPGVLAIVTDAAALFAIGIVPIPMLRKFALICGFWALALLPTTVLLAPVILSLLPTPRNVARLVGRDRRDALHAGIAGLLVPIARLSHGRWSRASAAALVGGTAFGLLSVTQLPVGSAEEGSALLWPEADYNRAVQALNQRFPGTTTLEIVFEGTTPAAMRTSAALHAMHAIQRRLESQPLPPAATLSFADYLPEVNRLFSGGHPEWLPLPRDEDQLNGVISALLFGSNVETLAHVVDLEFRNATIRAWVKDLTAATLERVLGQAEEAIAAVGEVHESFRIRLGSGIVALQKAVNDRVATYEVVIFLVLLGAMLVSCALAYRSVVAGLLLVIPVGVANLMLASCLWVLGISVDINTLPVTAIGIGIGIDYGIYLLSRLCEEAAGGAGIGEAIERSVMTTGKAIFFTAAVVTVGLLPWYWLSELRFQADMGLLLAMVMLINMLVALVAVPLLMYVFRPRFLLGIAKGI
jgi:hypothetical protein